MKVFSAIFAAAVCALVIGAPAHAETGVRVVPDVSRAEDAYADFLDAYSAVETIDSGFMREVDGRGRAAWEASRAKSAQRFSKSLERLQARTLSADESAAVRSMRRTFDELNSPADDARQPIARCEADDGRVAVTHLKSSLYACFDNPGNQIEFEGARPTRVAALQLLQELDAPERRRALFFAMQPLWNSVHRTADKDRGYRRVVQDAAAKFAQGNSPMHDAARAIGVPVESLESWLVSMLEAWRDSAAPRVPIEPWDYRYQYSAASRALASRIPKNSLMPLQARFYEDLGADLNRLAIHFDIEPRPGKEPIAYTDTVRIGRSINGHWRPAEVRVSANDDRGGLGILNELVHETGHAVHFLAIHARPAFFWPDNVFIEAFADVPSWSVFAPVWQQRYLGVSVSTAQGIREQYSGVMLDVAWSLFELRLLRDPARDPNQVWTYITSRYFGIAPHPEIAWWAVRAQLVSDPGYMINYGLGAVITAEIRAATRKSIGDFDAGNTLWYAWTTQHLLRDGAATPLPQLLRRFLGHELSPAPLIEDVRRASESRLR